MLVATYLGGTVATALIVVFALVAFANWMILATCLKLNGRHSSMVLLFVGFLGAVGFLMVPTLHRWAWLPLVLDPGMPIGVVGLPQLLRDLWQTASFNLVRSFEAENGRERARLELYRRGILVYRWTIDRPPTEEGMTGMSRPGTWSEKGDQLRLDLDGRPILMETRASGSAVILRRSAESSSGHDFPDLWSHDAEFVQTYSPTRRA